MLQNAKTDEAENYERLLREQRSEFESFIGELRNQLATKVDEIKDLRKNNKILEDEISLQRENFEKAMSDNKVKVAGLERAKEAHERELTQQTERLNETIKFIQEQEQKIKGLTAVPYIGKNELEKGFAKLRRHFRS